MANDRLIEVQATTGDVDGPTSATDNAVARFDGVSGKILQNSSVYILDTGDVGIGTDTPVKHLHILDATANEPVIRAAYDANYYLDIGYNQVMASLSDGTSDFDIGITTTPPGSGQSLNLKTSNTDRLTILDTGEVGIGTTAPDSLLHLVGTNPKLIIRGNSANDANIDLLETGDSFGVAGTNGMRLSYDGGDNKFYLKTGVSATVTDALTIDIVTNNVGIGTTNPLTALEIDSVDSDVDVILARFIHRATTPEVGAGIQLGGSSTDLGMSVKLIGYSDPSSNYNSRFSIFTSSGSGVWNLGLTQDKDGNVGIGTTTPEGNLDITGNEFVIGANSGGNQSPIIRLFENRLTYNHLGGYLRFDGPGNYLRLGTTGSDDVDDDFISIHRDTGLVGINNSTPTYQLDVTGTGRFTGILTGSSNDQYGAISTSGGIECDSYFTSIDAAVILGTSSAGTLYLRANGKTSTNQTTLSSTGNMVVAGTVTATNFILSSDIRLKENIVKASILELPEIKEFTFKSDKTKRLRRGVIAQELEKVAPEMVYENDEGMKQVAYTDFLLAKISSLETRIEQLEK